MDIGEGFAFDADLLKLATSANVCCGEYAGSWETTQETIGRCLDAGVRIGMHPGYPDREHMGRRTLHPIDAAEWGESVAAQVERFFFFVPAAYLKPHGALYNDAVNLPVAQAIAEGACRRFRLPLMGLPGTAHERIAQSAGVPFIREGFADRAYRPEGTLVPRSEPGAVLHDHKTIREQVLRLADRVDSICLHGDTPGCVEFAELVFGTLVDAGYEVGV